MTTKRKILIGSVTALACVGVASVPLPPGSMTPTEWQDLASVYNYEILQSGGSVQVQNFSSYDDLNDEIRKRVPTEFVDRDGEILTPEEYAKVREELMRKAETKSLFTKLIQK